MAKRRSKRRDAAPASSPTRTRPAHDPISVGRSPIRTAGVLDKYVVPSTRKVEDREIEDRRRQGRLAQVFQEVAERSRALHDAAHRKATAPIEQKARQGTVRKSDYGSLSRLRPETKQRVIHEPDNRKSPEKVRENPTCKERPLSNRGPGGSRSFVPWCKIKR